MNSQKPDFFIETVKMNLLVKDIFALLSLVRHLLGKKNIQKIKKLIFATFLVNYLCSHYVILIIGFLKMNKIIKANRVDS